MEKSINEWRTIHNQSINCICGKLGSGKTLLMTLLAYNEFLHNERVKIVSNYKTSFSRYQPDIKEMLRLKNSLLLVDEIITLADSRKWRSALNELSSGVVLRARKQNLTLYFTAQHPKLMDVRIRRIVNNYFSVSYSKLKRIIFVRNHSTGSKFQVHIRNKDIFDLYQTSEIVKSQYNTKANEARKLKKEIAEKNKFIDENFRLYG